MWKKEERLIETLTEVTATRMNSPCSKNSMRKLGFFFRFVLLLSFLVFQSISKFSAFRFLSRKIKCFFLVFCCVE